MWLVMFVFFVAADASYSSCKPPKIRCGCNEIPVPCRTICPPQSCNISYTEYLCDSDLDCEPGCDCKENYLRDNNNVCVFNEDCPAPPTSPIPTCGLNEIPVPCRTICPPQSCNISYTEYLCEAEQDCEPGCDCLDDYLRNENGVCVFNEDCPPPPRVCGDNEVATDCVPTCPPENCDVLYSKKYVCGKEDCQPGCKCRDHYYRNASGICVPKKKCPRPPAVPQCGINEVASTCKQVCPPQSCDWDPTRYACRPGPCQYGCNCIGTYLRNSSDICVPKSQCEPKITCGLNEILVPCKTICPPQACNISYTDYFCDAEIKCEPGCDCEENYLRDNNGICVFNENCPPPPPVCGDNEIATDCVPTCPPENCDVLYSQKYECGKENCQPGCKCRDHYYRNASGICVPKKKCPRPPAVPQCGINEVASTCKQVCPPQSCDWDPTRYACRPGPCQYGCNCIGTYLRNSSDICVPKSQCEPKITCGLNEILVPCKTICPPQACNISYTDYFCDAEIKCEPGCDCEENYLRDNNGICVFNENCPPPPPVCGDNEIATDCVPTCPPENCDVLYSQKYECGKENCQPGCKCRKKYYRNASGICVPKKECPRPPAVPQCGVNEVASTCKQVCPPQSCDWDPKRLACKPGPCQYGCNCIGTYLRNSSRICVPKDQCQPRPPSSCTFNRCTPTCSIPNPPNCPKQTPNDKCSCPSGYILSEKGGECVKLEDCQKYANCNGDRNATYRECPQACPSTCAEPSPKNCNKKCPDFGCQCEPGYILSEVNGKCILPDECPGGNPCGQNGTFAFCAAECPNNNCPQNDNLGTIACSPPYPCNSGCICKGNYRRVSSSDRRCILASDCPPVKCTRPNEVWNPCASRCASQECSDIGTPPSECGGSGPDCQPQCECKEEYYRNQSRICVTKEECPAS